MKIRCKKCGAWLSVGRALSDIEQRALARLGFYGTHAYECEYCKKKEKDKK